MRLQKIQPFLLALFAFLIPLAIVSPVRADLVLGFPNGLSGWSTYGDSGSVTASGGLATITDKTGTSETDLYINFTIPTGGAQSLQFTINSVSADSSSGGTGNPFFGASFGVIDPTQTPPTVSPLVPTVDQFTDSFLTMDVVTNPNPPLTTPMIVTVSYPAGVFAQVSLELPSNLAAGQSAGVLFRLNGGMDGDTGSSVTISNVLIVTGAAVPEPSSIIPGLSAVFIVAGVLGTRSRRRAGAKTHRVAS
jgi:hypothetical protein